MVVGYEAYPNYTASFLRTYEDARRAADQRGGEKKLDARRSRWATRKLETPERRNRCLGSQFSRANR